MVAKGKKTYGKKQKNKGHELASLFLDLSLSPAKPGTRAIPEILAPVPGNDDDDDDDDALIELRTGACEGEKEEEEEKQVSRLRDGKDDAGSGGERKAEAANQDDDKENRPSRKARLRKHVEERTARDGIPTEVSELTSLDFVGNDVVDFQRFCKGWKKEVRLSKVGQGSFATVLKMELKAVPGQYSVWKLMPLKPSRGTGSRPCNNQTLIKDAATEVKVLFAMSDIDGFVQFRSAHVVKGTVPDQISEAHDSWAKTLSPEDIWYGTKMEVEFPSTSQLWLLMEMTDAGEDLESMLSVFRLERKVLSIQETSDIFWGIAEALMRGEAQAKFEHRDLHPGNICVKLRDEPLDLTIEHGIPRLSKREITLIDYTQSRLTLDSGEVLATAVDESIFRQTDEDPVAQRQYNLYRVMRDVVKKEKKAGISTSQMWREWVPMTNVLWLQFMLKELMMVTRTKKVCAEERKMIKSLEQLGSRMGAGISGRWELRSAREVVSSYLIDPS